MDLKIHLTFIPTSDGQWSIAKLPEDTPSELKEALNQELYCAFLPLRRKCGLIQLRRSHGGSHSMIYLSSNANGVTVYECNVDGRNGIQTKTYSWSSFRSSNAAVSVYTAKDYRLH